MLERKNFKTVMKILSVMAVIGALFALFSAGASADVIVALQGAKDELSSGIKTILDTVVVPLGMLFAGGVLLFNVIKIAGLKSKGEDFKSNLTGVVVCVVVLILLVSWYAWGPALFS